MKYSIVDIDNEVWIELQEDPFAGVRYQYGRVEFEDPKEGEEEATLHFEFNVYDQRMVIQLQESPTFHKVIGDILIEMIEKQLQTNEVVYTGGV